MRHDKEHSNRLCSWDSHQLTWNFKKTSSFKAFFCGLAGKDCLDKVKNAAWNETIKWNNVCGLWLCFVVVKVEEIDTIPVYTTIIKNTNRFVFTINDISFRLMYIPLFCCLLYFFGWLKCWTKNIFYIKIFEVIL